LQIGVLELLAFCLDLVAVLLVAAHRVGVALPVVDAGVLGRCLKKFFGAVIRRR